MLGGVFNWVCMILGVMVLCSTSSLLFGLLDNASIQSNYFLLASTQLGLCLSSFFRQASKQAYNRQTWWASSSSAQWNMNFWVIELDWVSQAKATKQRPEFVIVYWVSLQVLSNNVRMNRIWFVGIFAGAYDIFAQGNPNWKVELFSWQVVLGAQVIG
jgi:hypothetical protein